MSQCKLIFTGDIVVNRYIDETFISENLNNYFLSADFRCCNLEAPVTMKKKKANKMGPSLSQSELTINVLKKLGFDLFDLANNHIMDFGNEGLANTERLLEGIKTIGAGLNYEDAYKEIILCKNGIKVGIIAVAEDGFGCCKQEGDSGYAWMNSDSLYEIIYKLKEECDYVIVICHAGAEEFELPLPEIRSLYKKYLGYGADIVIGHHPHIPQGIEKVEGKYICYSLGNFAFDDEKDMLVPYQPKGMILSILFSKENGICLELIPTFYQNGKVEVGDIEELNNYLEQQSLILADEKEYLKRVNDFCVTEYEKTYVNYYRNAVGVYNKTVKNRLGVALRIMLNKLVENPYLVYHNIAIETHRWIVIRAIKWLSEIE